MRPAGEFLHERTLAQRLAFIRLIFTCINFAVILLDDSVPIAGSQSAYAVAYGAAALYFVYAASAWILLRRHQVSLARYEYVAPLLDVCCAALLILATGGYLSPFNLWLAFAVVISGFGRYPWLPLLTACFGVAAQALITRVPQAQPLDVALFAVRTGYLFAFAAVLSLVNGSLMRQSRMLATIERFGQALADTVTTETAGHVLLTRLTEVLSPVHLELAFPDNATLCMGVLPTGRSTSRTWPLRIRGQELGQLCVRRRTPLTRYEEMVVAVLCDRTAATLLRVRLMQRLVDAATAAERVRVADALHDTSLQTLAALDLRLEAARARVAAGQPELYAELGTIKQTARELARQVREILQAHAESGEPGPASLRNLLATRWAGAWEACMAPEVTLSAGQWRAVELLVKEGLHNAQKHAAAERVSLELSRVGSGRTRCSLVNDSQPLREPVQFGYGLSRLRTVVAEQGGELTLAPVPGGTRLMAEFP